MSVSNAPSHSAIVAEKHDHVQVTRALISVSDKTDLIELATFLHSQGVRLVSTGGTAKAIRDAKLPVDDVESLTQFPEILHGRVKTLHPLIHGALLNIRSHPLHQQQVEKFSIPRIDLVIVNLYPFEKTVQAEKEKAAQAAQAAQAQTDSQTTASNALSFDTCVENIDIGGPAMIRSCAKNHGFLSVLTCPAQYKELMQEMRTCDGATSYQQRKKWAAEAFQTTAKYDSAIAAYFQEELQKQN